MIQKQIASYADEVEVGHNIMGKHCNSLDINFGSVENNRKLSVGDRLYEKVLEYPVIMFIILNKKDRVKVERQMNHQKNRLFLGDRRYHNYSASDTQYLLEPGQRL